VVLVDATIKRLEAAGWIAKGRRRGAWAGMLAAPASLSICDICIDLADHLPQSIGIALRSRTCIGVWPSFLDSESGCFAAAAMKQ